MGHTNILSECEADHEVIKHLMSEIAQLKRNNHMSDLTLFKDTDGTIKSVISWEAIDRTTLEIRVKDAEAELYNAKDDLANFDALSTPVAAAEPAVESAPAEEVPAEQPVEQAPVEQPQPEVTTVTVNEQPIEVPADGVITIDTTPEVPTDTSIQAEAQAPQPEVTATPAPAPIVIQ